MDALIEKLKHEVITRMHAIEVAMSLTDITSKSVKQARIIKYLKFLVSDTARSIEETIKHIQTITSHQNEEHQNLNIEHEFRTSSNSTIKVIEFQCQSPEYQKFIARPTLFKLLLNLIFKNTGNGDSYTNPILVKVYAVDKEKHLEILAEIEPDTSPLPLHEYKLQKTLDLITIEYLAKKISNTTCEILRTDKNGIKKILIKI